MTRLGWNPAANNQNSNLEAVDRGDDWSGKSFLILLRNEFLSPGTRFVELAMLEGRRERRKIVG